MKRSAEPDPYRTERTASYPSVPGDEDELQAAVVDADWFRPARDEELLWVGRHDRTPILAMVAGGVAVALLGVVLAFHLTGPFWYQLSPLLTVPIGLAFGARTLLRWRTTYYVLTTHNVYLRTGIVSRAVRSVPYGRIQDIRIEQPLYARAFDYGHVYVYTAGTSGVELLLPAVPDPYDFRRAIADRSGL